MAQPIHFYVASWLDRSRPGRPSSMGRRDQFGQASGLIDDPDSDPSRGFRGHDGHCLRADSPLFAPSIGRTKALSSSIELLCPFDQSRRLMTTNSRESCVLSKKVRGSESLMTRNFNSQLQAPVSTHARTRQ